jgi:predicted alpha/beta superfamily hydrolase
MVIAALLLAEALAACRVSDATATMSVMGPPVTLPSSEVVTLTSSSTGRTYDIYIGYPHGYPVSGSAKYSVLYLLDAQWDFKLVQAIVDNEGYDKQVPALIIVGITYSGRSPDYDSLRSQDYTPVPSSDVPGSGGAAKFLQFLRTELIPYVEVHFRADPAKRVLMGSSYGGLFTLYAMLRDPELCRAYIAASPAVTFGGSAVLDQEKEYAAKRHDLPARLWVGVGGSERLSAPVQSFSRSLAGRGYTGLTMETRLIDGEGHSGSKAEAFSRGLRYVFTPRP